MMNNITKMSVTNIASQDLSQMINPKFFFCFLELQELQCSNTVIVNQVAIKIYRSSLLFQKIVELPPSSHK